MTKKKPESIKTMAKLVRRSICDWQVGAGAEIIQTAVALQAFGIALYFTNTPITNVIMHGHTKGISTLWLFYKQTMGHAGLQDIFLQLKMKYQPAPYGQYYIHLSDCKLLLKPISNAYRLLGLTGKDEQNPEMLWKLSLLNMGSISFQLSADPLIPLYIHPTEFLQGLVDRRLEVTDAYARATTTEKGKLSTNRYMIREVRRLLGQTPHIEIGPRLADIMANYLPPKTVSVENGDFGQI